MVITWTTLARDNRILPPFCLRNPGTGGAVRAKFVKTWSNTFSVSSAVKSTCIYQLNVMRALQYKFPRHLSRGNPRNTTKSGHLFHKRFKKPYVVHGTIVFNKDPFRRISKDELYGQIDKNSIGISS